MLGWSQHYMEYVVPIEAHSMSDSRAIRIAPGYFMTKPRRRLSFLYSAKSGSGHKLVREGKRKEDRKVLKKGCEIY